MGIVLVFVYVVNCKGLWVGVVVVVGGFWVKVSCFGIFDVGLFFEEMKCFFIGWVC